MNPLDRRTFLATVGSAALAAASGCGSAPTPRRKLDRIGLQLYTVRGLMEKDLPGTLAQVAQAGYREVEFAGYFGHSALEIRDLLAQNGLTSPASHIPLEAMRKEWRKSLDDAKQAGHQWVVIPWLPAEDRGGADAWKRLAAELNAAARPARDAGLRFAYHNHDFELEKIPPAAGEKDTGQRPLDILIAETDPSLVEFELDVYWVVKAGADPFSYITRLGKRMPLLHLKDSAGPPSHAITDVGGGSIDFRRILAEAEKVGVRHFFAERDDAPDPLASIRASYDYLRALEY